MSERRFIASSRRWRDDWDAASESLLEVLAEPRPDDDEVRELIERRQQLTTANLKAEPSDSTSPSAQRSWLDAAVNREQAIRRAYQKYCDVVVKSVEMHRTGARVRATFADRAESRPTRLYKTY